MYDVMIRVSVGLAVYAFKTVAFITRGSTFRSSVQAGTSTGKDLVIRSRSAISKPAQWLWQKYRSLSGWRKWLMALVVYSPFTWFVATVGAGVLFGEAEMAAEEIIREELQRDIDKIQEIVEKDKDKLVKKAINFPKQIGYPFIRDLARLTPHRGRGFVRRRDGSYWYSGRAAANWVVRQTLGGLDWLIPPSPDRAEMVRLVSEKAKRKLYQIGWDAHNKKSSVRFYISNPVHYMDLLNRGSSLQAKPGFIDRIEAAHRRRLDKLYRRHFDHISPLEALDVITESLETVERIRKYEGIVEKIKEFERVISG